MRALRFDQAGAPVPVDADIAFPFGPVGNDPTITAHARREARLRGRPRTRWQGSLHIDLDPAFLKSEGMREDFAERLFDDVPVSTADLLRPSLDVILVDPRHLEIRRRVDRHLDPPLKRSKTT